MQVGKKDRLLVIYQDTKTGTRLLDNLDKKDTTWILLYALYYNWLTVLKHINPEADNIVVEVNGEEKDGNAVEPVPP